MSRPVSLRLGTRNSPLARWQADWVTTQLERAGVEVELVPITTSGDRNQAPVGAGSAVGLFTKEIQRALFDHRIDLAVHSLKDLPTEKVPGLALSAVPERAAVADVLVCSNYASLDALPRKATVGTGSLRRRAQLLHVCPDLIMQDMRGNVDTRLRKLAGGACDALILAEAGLRRLDLAEHIRQVLPCEVVLPAVGQGALGLETRADDSATRQALEPLDHRPTHLAVLAERAMLATLQGGCLAPVAAWARMEGEALVLTGRVLKPDGSERLETTMSEPADEAVALGCRVADALLAQGAAHLIQDSRQGGLERPE